VTSPSQTNDSGEERNAEKIRNSGFYDGLDLAFWREWQVLFG
jgi:hypothetical protein